MDLSNAQQTAVLLWSLLFGAGLGAAYDLLRAWRVFVPCGTVVLFFQDLIWFFFAGIASFVFIFEVNDGTVRLFILLAFFTGGLVWRTTAGQLFLRLCTYLKRRFFSGTRKSRRTHNKHSRGKEEGRSA